MNSDAEAGPSQTSPEEQEGRSLGRSRPQTRAAEPRPRRKDEGAFGPLRYDDRADDEWDQDDDAGGAIAGGTGADITNSRSGGPPPTNCEVAVRRGELQLLKGAGASVIYEMAVRCFLGTGRPAVLVDGGCQADPYEVAAIAKRLDRERRGETGGGNGGGGEKGAHVRARRVDEDEVLRNIHVARAFTAHQLEALIVSRLEPMLNRVRPAFVGVLSLDALFHDYELDIYESRVMQVRCVRTLRRLAREHNLLAAATENGAGRRSGWRPW